VGFDTVGGEDSKYYEIGDRPQHSYDVLSGGFPQWCYQGITPDNSYMSICTMWCWKDKHVLYSDNCHSSEHLFGCVGLKRAKHAIFNKAYTAHDYEREAARLVRQMEDHGEWGDFFPVEHSPFGYNNTYAQDYYPLSADEARSRGYPWRAEDQRAYKPQAAALPDHIKDAPDAIVQELLACESCRRNYKIMPLELQFYRKMKLALPRRCPECRRLARVSQDHIGRLWERSCGSCGKAVESPYSGESGVPVSCRECYLRGQ